MGSYSYFEFETLETTDLKGLKKWIKDVSSKKPLYKSTPGFDYSNYQTYVSMIELPGKKDDTEITFGNFTDMKIISYWYPEFLAFLRDAALFIKGQVSWSFEDKDEAAYVKFENLTCEIHIGTMNYEKYELDEFSKAPHRDRELPTNRELTKIKIRKKL